MSESLSAIVNDVDALYLNPGALYRLKPIQFLYEHAEWFQDVRYENIALAAPLKVIVPDQNLPLVFGFGFQYLYSSPMDIYSDWGIVLQSLSFNSFRVKGAVSTRVLKAEYIGLGAGVGFSINGKNVGGAAKSLTTFDLGTHGLLYHHNDTLKEIFGSYFNFALAVQNIGLTQTGGREDAAMLFRFGLGASLYKMLNLDIDLSKSIDSALQVGLGAEYWLMNMVALRAGGFYGSDRLNNFSFGMGFKYPLGNYGVSLDYALLPQDALGLTHRVSLKMDVKKIEFKKPVDDSDIYYYKGVNLFIQNDYDKALEMFQKTLKKNPSNKEAKKRIEEIKKIKDFEEKQKELKKLEDGFRKYQESLKEAAPSKATGSE
jgi:tetratricopeptide (TPR) repeat protein